MYSCLPKKPKPPVVYSARELCETLPGLRSVAGICFHSEAILGESAGSGSGQSSADVTIVQVSV